MHSCMGQPRTTESWYQTVTYLLSEWCESLLIANIALHPFTLDSLQLLHIVATLLANGW
jgi:hypothetical protein